MVMPAMNRIRHQKPTSLGSKMLNIPRPVASRTVKK